MKAIIEITDEMAIAHALCNKRTDCEGCPCCIGEGNCIYDYATVEN